MLELVAVRHGRTAWNADGRFQGHTDVPLDAEGRAQAQALAAYLRDEVFDAAVCSDLRRAADTARIVLGTRPLALREDRDWRELAFGTWEGLTWPQIVERYPEYAERPRVQPKFYHPEGGESFDAACERIARAVETIKAAMPNGGRVLVGTHAGPLHALLRVALGENERDALGVRFSPGSVTRVAFDGATARLHELNTVPSPVTAGDASERG